jgi:hypothetical protein
VSTVRIKTEGRIRLTGTTFRQFHMLQVGKSALESFTKRVAAGRTPQDVQAKPLTKRYAIRKSKMLRGKAVRDLRLTGAMLDNLTVRSASDNRVTAALTSRKARIKALANERIQHWMAFSPSDRRNIMQVALTSEIAAWAFVFGLGASVKSGTTAISYMCTPQDPVGSGIELPAFSFIETNTPPATQPTPP